jgi:hypothetical protein
MSTMELTKQQQHSPFSAPETLTIATQQFNAQRERWRAAFRAAAQICPSVYNLTLSSTDAYDLLTQQDLQGFDVHALMIEEAQLSLVLEDINGVTVSYTIPFEDEV